MYFSDLVAKIRGGIRDTCMGTKAKPLATDTLTFTFTFTHSHIDILDNNRSTVPSEGETLYFAIANLISLRV